MLLFFKTTNSTAQDFSLNLITEIIGIFLTVFFIDFVLRRKEEKEKKKLLSNIYAQYLISAKRLLDFFAVAYKASTLNKPSEWDTDFKTLFSNPEFYSSLKHLDFLKNAPIAPTANWLNYSRSQMILISDGFEKLIDKYAFIMDSKTISDLDYLSNYWVIDIIKSGQHLKNIDESLNLKRDSFCLLNIESDNNDNDIKILIDKVFEVAEYFRSITDDNSNIHYSSDLWRNDIMPKIGDSRED